MDNPLIAVRYVKQGQARGERGLTRFGDEGLSARHQRLVAAADPGIDNVIHHRENPGGIMDRAPGRSHRFQRGSARAFVQEDPVNRDQGATAGGFGHPVRIPDLVEQCWHDGPVLHPASANASGMRHRHQPFACNAIANCRAALARTNARHSNANCSSAMSSGTKGIAWAALPSYQGAKKWRARAMAQARVR